MHLSILVATCGRRTLDKTLASITPQLESGDEILVYYDTSGDPGDTARNRMMPQARGTHFVFVDDDDELLPGALAAIRRFGVEHPSRIGIFRLNYGFEGPRSWSHQGDLWSTQTGMYVVPNVPGRLGRWGSPPGAPARRQGDYTFIVETVALQGDPVWCEEVIQEVRPVQSRFRRLRYGLALRTRARRLLGINRAPTVLPRMNPEAFEWAVARTRELRASLGNEARSEVRDEAEV